MRLLDFSASWCQPCKTQEPIIHKWAEQHPEVKIEKVGVENPQGAALASQFFVQSVPTLVFLSAKGQVLAAEPGLHDASRLNAMYEQALRREAMTPK